MGLRQLSGMLVLVFARKALRDVLGEVSTASVACGVLGVGGNKGAVALSFTLYRRKLAVVCSHFAAHQVRAHQALMNTLNLESRDLSPDLQPLCRASSSSLQTRSTPYVIST